jgi:hypothetical protein
VLEAMRSNFMRKKKNKTQQIKICGMVLTLAPLLVCIQRVFNHHCSWKMLFRKVSVQWSYRYLKLAVLSCFSCVFYLFIFYKIRTGGWNGSSVCVWRRCWHCCGSMVREETKPHSESGELRFNFYASRLRCVPVSEPLNKGFTRYLEGSAGHQVTKLCSVYGVLTSELDCLG